MLWLIILVAKTIDNISSFVHAVTDIRRNMYERSITPRMWYYQAYYNWTEAGGHGVYIRYDNGKTRLVRVFPTSQYARDYLNHKVKKYLDNSEHNEQLYAEKQGYKPIDYKVYPGDRTTYDTSSQGSKDT